MIEAPCENWRSARVQVIVERFRVADRIALRNIPQRCASVNRALLMDKDFS